MKKTICIILFAVSISANLVGMMEDQNSRERVFISPDLTPITGTRNPQCTNSSLLTYNEAYVHFNLLSSFAQGNNNRSNISSDPYSSDEYNEEEQEVNRDSYANTRMRSSVTFNLENLNEDGENEPYLKRSLSPLPVSFQEVILMTVSLPILRKNAVLELKKGYRGFPLAPTSANNTFSKETSYEVIDWKPFHVMLYNDREREIMSKPSSPNVTREKESCYG